MIEYKHEFLFGSKKLYQWFKQNDVLGSPSIGWYPLEEKDGSIPTSSPLHKAVMSKDLREVEKCLKDGANVNEVDEMGDTPLHIAVRNLREKRQDAQGCLVMSEEALALCRLLLKNGANPSLFNVAHHTALHEAVRTDDEGVCLQLLLDAKANVNAHVSHYYKPLGMAVDAKNIKAIEILIKAGAVIADYDFKQLHDPAFASLRGILEKCVADGGIWGPTTYHYVEK
jgi:ankyrin repeat protein